MKLVTIIFVLTLSQAKGQVQNWVWARAATGNNIAIGEGSNVATDIFGNCYLTGRYKGTMIFGMDTLTSSEVQPYVVKYNSVGNPVWAKSAVGYSYNYGWGVAADRAGNVYIAGNFGFGTISFDSYTLTCNVGDDIFLVKYDSTGNVLWATSVGGAGSDICIDLATDTSGNVFITGRYNSSSILFGSYLLTNSGSMFVAKYDSSGNVLWAKSAVVSPQGYLAQGYSVSTDLTGNVYVTGVFNSDSIAFDTFILVNAATNYDIFLTKYDASGNVLWAKRAGGTGFDYSRDVTTDRAGNAYITGTFSSDTISFGPYSLFDPAPTQQVFIAKYDSGGNELWAKGSTGIGYATAYSISADAIGHEYIIGHYDSSKTFDFYTVPFLNNFEATFLTKYDSSGNAFFAMGLTGGGDDESAVACDASNDIFIGGDFMVNPFILGNDTLWQTGSENPFVAKLGHQIIENISKSPEASPLVLFPNPFSNELNVRIGENIPYEITLFDILSRKLLQQTFTGSVSLNTSQLPKGIYIYDVRTKSRSIKGKICKN